MKQYNYGYSNTYDIADTSYVFVFYNEHESSTFRLLYKNKRNFS
ncbi:hypothetical protein [Proteiniborus sp. DW1]|nr:hypothetical protein [Proteiniborus sp. DW1]